LRGERGRVGSLIRRRRRAAAGPRHEGLCRAQHARHAGHAQSGRHGALQACGARRGLQFLSFSCHARQAAPTVPCHRRMLHAAAPFVLCSPSRSISTGFREVEQGQPTLRTPTPASEGWLAARRMRSTMLSRRRPLGTAGRPGGRLAPLLTAAAAVTAAAVPGDSRGPSGGLAGRPPAPARSMPTPPRHLPTCWMTPVVLPHLTQLS
jgi:hypothetical protein